MMKPEENEVNLIINQIKKLGLDFEITKNNKWVIYLKEGDILFQTKTQWLLFIKENAQIYISNSEVLKFLEQ